MNYDEELGKIVWNHIDCMNDYDTPEEADKILQRFIKDCKPIIDACLDQVWLDKYGYTYTEFLQKKLEKRNAKL